jgi:hypothetical protein
MSVSVAVLVAGGSGCATQTATDATGTAAALPPAPASNPLAKVDLGMTKKQVRDAIGQPTDENSYATGKAWIPFYFGTDARRTCWFYEDMGRVVFADGNVFGGGTGEVIRVDYDPAESGVAR